MYFFTLLFFLSHHLFEDLVSVKRKRIVAETLWIMYKNPFTGCFSVSEAQNYSLLVSSDDDDCIFVSAQNNQPNLLGDY